MGPGTREDISTPTLWLTHHTSYTPRFNEVEQGVYWFHVICPSLRPSVCGQNRVRSVSSTILARSISYLHILSSNFRRCVACKGYCKIPNFDCLAIFMPLPLGAGGIMFSGCPSVRPSVTEWQLRSNSPKTSVRPERFPGICLRMHGGISLKFYMLMYLDHLQNWLVYGHGLLIFLILALFWLSETGQIWGFRAFPRERMEGMAWNFARWCILTTFRTD